MNDAYSYHTFILPLTWASEGRGNMSYDKLCKLFRKNSYWKSADPDPGTGFSNEDEPLDFYAEYQYFYPQARGALYGYDGQVVSSFIMAEALVKNKAVYRIVKGTKTYELLLNAVRLKIYSSGVILLMLECENHSYKDIASVKAINDYGRRVLPPIINKSKSICADKLEIDIPNLGNFTTDFSAFIGGVSDLSKDDMRQRINLDYMAGFVRKLLGFGSEYSFVSNPSNNRKQIYIRPILDDRMFVACTVTDKELTHGMLSKNEGGEYAYLCDSKLEESLYEFIFIDTHENCSCQDRGMRKKLLSEHVYERWLDSNSIYAIAAQSIVFLTDGGEPYLIGYFLTEYVKMACLCLAQRASLILFQGRIASISKDMSFGKRTNLASISAVRNIQESFSVFESQLCFSEISSQEQAIELYDMFKDSFNIKTELENVKSQLNGLFETSETMTGLGFNKMGYRFTVLGAILSIAGIFKDDFQVWISRLFGWEQVPKDGIEAGAKEAATAAGAKEAFILFGVLFVLGMIAFSAVNFVYRRRK